MKSLPIVISLLTFPCLVTAIALLGFVAGVPVQRWYVPLAFVASTVIAVVITSESRRGVVFIFGATILVAIFVSSLPVMYCVSDALNCYRVGVAMMTEGWNPLVETEVSDIVKYGSGFNPWHVAYAFKIPFIFGAALCKTFGWSCAGDSLNFILFVAAFLTIYSWFKTEKHFSRRASIFLTLCFLLSPNVVGLSIGGKSDPALFHCIVISLVACDLYRKQYNLAWLSVFMLTTILASGIKATGLVSCCLICFIAGVRDLFASFKKGHICKSLLRWLLMLCVGFLMAVMFNPSPIMTSTIKHGTPFYPIRTADGAEVPQSVTQLTNDCDVMNDDAQMLGAMQRYIRAYVSQGLIDKVMASRKGAPFHPKWPELFTQPDGYGSFFRVCFVLAIIGFFFIRDSSICYMVGSIFLTTIIVPTKFVGLAHYVQQIYLLPLLVGIGLILRFQSANLKRCFAIIGIVYCAVLSLPKMSIFPYVWLSSVQSLQILDVIQRDLDPVVESRYYYGKFLWRHDSCRNVKVISSSNISALYADRKSYGPVARRYSYLCKGNMPNNYYDYNFKDVGREQTFRRENAIVFFLKDFLPVEWKNVGARICQWAKLRSCQFYRAWADI